MFDRDDAEWASESHFRARISELAHNEDARAVVIRAGATSSARAKAALLIGATHTYLLTADPRDLAHRVASRNRADKRAGLASIKTWFDQFDRLDGVRDFPGWEAEPDRTATFRATSREW
jgi:hypothetical protein